MLQRTRSRRMAEETLTKTCDSLDRQTGEQVVLDVIFELIL